MADKMLHCKAQFKGKVIRTSFLCEFLKTPYVKFFIEASQWLPARLKFSL